MGTAQVAWDEFVNPYTFVQLPKEDPPEDWRSAPPGHGELKPGRWSGVLEVKLTARSPLLLRNVYDGADGRFPIRKLPGFDRPVPYIPGSSLAGTVRSLHETIAGGCLRVFNGEFRPGYRDDVHGSDTQSRTGWRLALVEEVDERGAPSQLTLCKNEPVWVESAVLHQALGGPEKLRSGARVTVVSQPERSSLNRLEVTSPDGEVKAGGRSVVLVTDAGTRRKTRKNPQGGPSLRGRYFCATGELEDRQLKVTLPDEVWDTYLDAVDGTDDMRRARMRTNPQDRQDDKPIRVLHPNPKGERLLGKRDPARRELRPGQVVWVRQETSGDGVLVKEISWSVVWRHAGGQAKAKDRVPEHLKKACESWESLCPSCRLFGSADTHGAKDGPARQSAYRGHVRFGDAVPSEAYEPKEEWLPPLGAPKPGSGQFYLTRNDGQENNTASDQSKPPLREWGSELDEKAPRKLRGRKQYWLTESPETRPYFRARSADDKVFHDLYKRDDGENKMLARGQSVGIGAVFTARVWFENLSLGELGGLLSALDPGQLLHAYDRKDEERPLYGLAVGGGRPLGFGTCTTRVTVVEADQAESRYLGEPGTALDVDAAVAAFRKAAPKELRDNIWKRQLTKVLRLDWAPADRVWYPPADILPSPHDDTLDPKVLKSSFTFWQETTGGRAKSTTYPYRQLPNAAAPSPGIKVIRQKEGKEGGGQQ